MTIRTLLVGLGKIGVRYDSARRVDKFAQSHARAIQQCSAFNLVAGVDIDFSARKEFEDAYKKPAFESLQGCSRFPDVDLVVIATPTDTHLNVVESVLESLDPSAILCEKPVGAQTWDTRAIVAMCEQRGVQLWVNYIRRTNKQLHGVRDLLREESRKNRFEVTLWMNGCLRHSGCHFIDLLIYWFGFSESHHSNQKIDNSRMNHNEAGGFIDLERASVTVKEAPGASIDFFKVRLESKDLLLEYVEPEYRLSWVQKNSNRRSEVDVDLRNYQADLAIELLRAIRGDSSVVASGRDALEVQIAIDRIERSEVMWPRNC